MLFRRIRAVNETETMHASPSVAPGASVESPASASPELMQLSGPGAGTIRAAVVHRLQRAGGNQAVQAALGGNQTEEDKEKEKTRTSVAACSCNGPCACAGGQ